MRMQHPARPQRRRPSPSPRQSRRPRRCAAQCRQCPDGGPIRQYDAGVQTPAARPCAGGRLRTGGYRSACAPAGRGGGGSAGRARPACAPGARGAVGVPMLAAGREWPRPALLPCRTPLPLWGRPVPPLHGHGRRGGQSRKGGQDRRGRRRAVQSRGRGLARGAGAMRAHDIRVQGIAPRDVPRAQRRALDRGVARKALLAGRAARYGRWRLHLLPPGMRDAHSSPRELRPAARTARPGSTRDPGRAPPRSIRLHRRRGRGAQGRGPLPTGASACTGAR